jgi:hypothetical protein
MTKKGGRRIRSITFLLLGTTAASANAQTPPLRLTETLRALRDSQMVRTVAVGLGRSQGRVLEHSNTLLVLRGEGELVRVPSTSIDSLWIQGSNSKKGLAWGAGVGAVAGLGLGVLVTQFCRESETDDSCPEAIPILGLGGAAVGTAVGALVGAMIPKWQRRWP